MTDKTPSRRLNPSTLVLLSLLLGVATGVFFGEMVAWMQVLGDIFIKLLQITVIPFISVSLITGLGRLRFEEVRSLAATGGGVLLLVWIIVISVLVFIPLAFPNWPSGSFFSASLVSESKAPDFLRLFIPSNPFYAYANAVVPAVVVFSILFGLGLIGLPAKDSVLEPLETVREVLMKITGGVTKLTPVGVFALMAHLAGTVDLEDLVRLQVYIVLYAVVALFLGLWVLPALVSVLTSIGYRDILRALRSPVITGFATGSSLVVLPMLIEQCKALVIERSTQSTEAREKRYGAAVKILVPMLYPFPQSGALLILLFPLFSAWYIGSSVSLSEYPLLVFAGVPTLFGGSFLTITFLLDLLKLPNDLVQVFFSMDVINARFGTLLGIMHYSCITLIAAVGMVGGLRIKWLALLRYALVSLVLLAILIFGARAFYNNIVVAPYTKADALRRLDLLGDRQPSVQHPESPAELDKIKSGPANFVEIGERGVLHVCYQPNEYPSAFYNDATPPRLVGFDIELAHRIAKRGNLKLEFFPARDEDEGARLLNAGVCDLYMRSLPISGWRTMKFALTEPVYQSPVGLIVLDHRRDEFRTWKQIHELGENFRLGLDGSMFSLAGSRDLFPDATLVAIADMVEQESILESGAQNLDAITDMAEEGAAWTLLYPAFTVIVPQPTVLIPVAYAVARGNQDVLLSTNAWLTAEKAKGTIDELYDYWMLGGAIKKERPPRWSVIRNILRWVE